MENLVEELSGVFDDILSTCKKPVQKTDHKKYMVKSVINKHTKYNVPNTNITCTRCGGKYDAKTKCMIHKIGYICANEWRNKSVKGLKLAPLPKEKKEYKLNN